MQMPNAESKAFFDGMHCWCGHRRDEHGFKSQDGFDRPTACLKCPGIECDEFQDKDYFVSTAESAEKNQHAIEAARLMGAVKTAAALRAAAALKCLQLLENAIQRNRGWYHGGLVPNMMSVQLLLTVPDSELAEALKTAPEIVPTDEQVRQLAEHWGKG